MSTDPLDALEQELGEQLRAELRADIPPVPPQADARILDQARQHTARLRRHRKRRWLLALVVPAAAAAVALVAVLPLDSRPPPPVAPPPSEAADLNADGELNILDAFVLARAVEQGRTAPEWDQDGDGRVGAPDVELLARSAVSVPTGGAP